MDEWYDEELPKLGSDDDTNYPAAINDKGLIVGSSGTFVGGTIPVLWQNGQVYNLNSLLPAGTGWVLDSVSGINDSNIITGYGTYNGVGSNFELTLQTLTYSAATVASEQTRGMVSSITAIADSAANVSANLDALAAVAAQGDLGPITLTDSATPTLILSVAQTTSDAAVLNAISGPFSLSLSDTAANISADLDALNGLFVSGKVASTSLTDSAALSVTAAQLTSDAVALKDISGGYTLKVAAGTSMVAIAGFAGHATTITFTGDASEYIVGVANGAVTVTIGGVNDTLSNIAAIQFADTTAIVADTPGSANAVTTGNVTELYAAVLARIPDVGGLTFYQNYLTAHPATPLQQFAEWFLNSAEYTSNPAHNYAQTAAGDTQFINDSYQNLLHRTPSAAEVSFYETNVLAPAVAGLTPGTQAYASAQLQAHALMLVYFSASAEFLSDVQVTATTPPGAQHWLILT